MQHMVGSAEQFINILCAEKSLPRSRRTAVEPQNAPKIARQRNRLWISCNKAANPACILQPFGLQMGWR